MYIAATDANAANTVVVWSLNCATGRLSFFQVNPWDLAFDGLIN